MRVVIAAAAFSAEMSGVQRHAFNMARALEQREEVHEVHLIVAPWQLKLAQSVEHEKSGKLFVHASAMGDSRIARNLWYYYRLPEIVRALGADVAHLAFPMPIKAGAFPCPVAVTLHDLYPYEIPGNFGFPKSLVNRAVLRQCLEAADGIASVSETTRDGMQKYLPARLACKTVCISNCVLPMPQAVRPEAAVFSDEPFLLCVAQHRKNKNIPLLLQSFSRLIREARIDLRMQLLIVGIQGPDTARIRRVTDEYKLSGKAHFLSGLSEAQLHWLYDNCEALIAPSSTEGFGLPVVEGLLAGCRVVCSEIGAHREVGAGHCFFVDLRRDAERSLALAIFRALQTPRPSAVSFPQFSMKAIGAQCARFYRRLIEERAIEDRSRLGIAVRGA